MTEKKRSCVKLEGEEIIPICYFCMKVMTNYDYCFGCKKYVCEECDLLEPMGKHCADDHQNIG